MRLLEDNKTCENSDQILLMITNNELRGLDVSNLNVNSTPRLISSLQLMEPVAIDFVVNKTEPRFYWSDAKLNEIQSVGLVDIVMDTIHNNGISNVTVNTHFI